MAAAIGALLTVTGTAHATFPGANGLLAYTTVDYDSAADEPRRSLHAVRPDGSGDRVVAAADTGEPRFTPSGDAILHTRVVPGWDPELPLVRNGDPFTVGAGGSPTRALFSTPGAEWAPSFDPAADRISFVGLLDGRMEVLTRRADGSDPRRLTTNPRDLHTWATTWSPDGRWIAFARGTPREVLLVRPDGTGLHSISPSPDAAEIDPEWAPDGRSLVFQRDRDVWRYDLDAATFERVTHAPEGVEYRHPVPSPDGRFIAAFRRWDDSIVILDARSGEVVGAHGAGRFVSDLDWQPAEVRLEVPVEPRPDPIMPERDLVIELPEFVRWWEPWIELRCRAADGDCPVPLIRMELLDGTLLGRAKAVLAPGKPARVPLDLTDLGRKLLDGRQAAPVRVLVRTKEGGWESALGLLGGERPKR